MSWFEKLIPARIGARSNEDKGNVPEGVWVKCDHCSNVLYHAELERAQDVCIKCGHHMMISARKRLDRLLDPGEREEIGDVVEPVDMLKFKDSKRYKVARYASRRCCLRLPLHGRFDGFGCWRTILPSLRSGVGGGYPVHLLQCQWGCPHAGSVVLLTANGKNQCHA